MKKLIFVTVFLISMIGFAQGGPKVDVIKYRDVVTTTIRDTFDVPAGEIWLLWNETTTQLEIAQEDDVWTAIAAGAGDMILATAQTSTGKKTFLSDATNAGINMGSVTVTPSSPAAGDMHYRSDLGFLFYRDGSADRQVISAAGAQTFTNKNVDLNANSFTGTKANFNTALSDDDFFYIGGGTLTGLVGQQIGGGSPFSTYFGTSAGTNDDNTTNGNTGIGFAALNTLTTGLRNAALGGQSLTSNIAGSWNTALGYGSLETATGASETIGIGYEAGKFITGGVTSNLIPVSSIYIGNNTRAAADSQTNQIVIGNDLTGNGANTVTIGNASITDNYFNGNIVVTGTVDGIDVGVDVAANTAKVGNATHTGDVTGATALTIGADKILESMLKAVNGATDEYSLTFESTTGDFEWEKMLDGNITGRTGTTIDGIMLQTAAQIVIDGAPASDEVVICSDCKVYAYPQIAISDLTTSLTTGDVKGFWIAPADGTIESPANDGVSIYLLTAGTVTGVTMEIDKNGADITTTGITTDATENDSDDAATDFVLTTYTFVRGDKFAFNLDAVPTAGAGAVVTLKVYYD